MGRIAVFLSLVTIATVSLRAQDAPARDMPPADQEAGADPAPPDVGGVWVQKHVTTGVCKVKLIGSIISQTTSYKRVEVAQSGDQLEMTEQTCDMDIRTNRGSVRTHVPDALVESMEPVRRSAKLKPRGEGYYLSAPRATKVLGARLDDVGDKLPSKASDARVFDQDGDGHPGITVNLNGALDADVYLVQRSWDQLWGKLMSNGQFAGRVKWKNEQVSLGSTSRIVGRLPTIKPHSDANESYFRMVPLDEDLSCDEIARQKDKLFK
jgi:hypothetical protein